MKSNKLNRKDAFRMMRVGWILQYCEGPTLASNWWWLRKTVGSSEVLHVHTNAACSIIKNNLVERVGQSTRTSENHYRIRPAPASRRQRSNRL